MILTAENLSKDYTGCAGIGEKILSAATLGLYAGSFRHRALEGVNLNLGGERNGEIVGVIGPNGAGKSTLLNILSGVLKPTSGDLRFPGSVRSILELGVGFHGDLTALENIYYNGILWGYSKKILREKKDELFHFAGLSEYENHPLNTFSTGMQMRLAFSLATLLPADMLLVDEALAVGDASFQQKGVRRFQEFRERGSLVLVVSHDIHMLVSLSDRMMLLDKGRLLMLDKPSVVAERYMDLIAERSREESSQSYVLEEKSHSAVIQDSSGKSRRHFFTGEGAVFIFRTRPEENLEDVTAGIHINDSRGIRVFGTNSRLLKKPVLHLEKGQTSEIEFHLILNLGPGKYSAGFSLHRGLSHGTDCYFWEEGLLDFEVEQTEKIGFEGISYLEPEIKIHQKEV